MATGLFVLRFCLLGVLGDLVLVSAVLWGCDGHNGLFCVGHVCGCCVRARLVVGFMGLEVPWGTFALVLRSLA